MSNLLYGPPDDLGWSIRQWLPAGPLFGPPLPLRLGITWPWNRRKPGETDYAADLLRGINTSTPTRANLDAFAAAAADLQRQGKVTSVEYQELINAIARRRAEQY